MDSEGIPQEGSRCALVCRQKALEGDLLMRPVGEILFDAHPEVGFVIALFVFCSACNCIGGG